MEATTNPVATQAPGITAEDVQAQREYFGLDKPAHERYLTWLGNFATGDMGHSLHTNQGVWPELYGALRNSLQLGLFAFGFYVGAGVTIGTIAALKHRSVVDQARSAQSTRLP
jgi:ABC-type dipeptide/oligopeptide/nickel transport system permease component